MLYRNRKKNDTNAGKWIGTGGKRESGETYRECMKREILEETGLTAEQLDYRGILYFHYDHKEDETIRIYTCTSFHGDLKECDEGTLEWIEQERILDLPLWEGDKLFLEKLINNDMMVFCLELFYDEAGNLICAKQKEAEEE